MLNELNKNHMGGIENFGSEDLYNLDDAWDDRMQDVKPKVLKLFVLNWSLFGTINCWPSLSLSSSIYSVSRTRCMVAALPTSTTAGDRSATRRTTSMTITVWRARTTHRAAITIGYTIRPSWCMNRRHRWWPCIRRTITHRHHQTVITLATARDGTTGTMIRTSELGYRCHRGNVNEHVRSIALLLERLYDHAVQQFICCRVIC